MTPARWRSRIPARRGDNGVPRRPARARASRWTACILAVLGASAFLAGCGVPTNGEIRDINTEDVPYGLLKETPQRVSGQADTATDPGHISGLIALVHGAQAIRLVERQVPAGTPAEVAQALLQELKRGPTDMERRQGLASAVSAGARFRVNGWRDGILSVVISGEENPAPDRLPLTVGQVVFTATSAPGVQAVQLQRDDTAVDVPLIDGSLSSAPLTRQHYQQLLNSVP